MRGNRKQVRQTRGNLDGKCKTADIAGATRSTSALGDHGGESKTFIYAFRPRAAARTYQMQAASASSSSTRSISAPRKSPRDTMPKMRPFSTTGRCRNPLSDMTRSASMARERGVIVTGDRVITLDSGVRAGSQHLDNARTASRPVNMPAS
jgi:hypothetical protein